jgi:16S rRNA (guanine966-N2)-methyltransferase
MHAAPHRASAASITAGAWKGRKLRYPADARVRPTMRRTKESLFSSLGPALAGSVFADLYAGAGAVGIEALSRGARRVHFVECDPAAVRMLRENLALCGAEPSRYVIHAARVADVLAAVPCPIADATLAFADPPYTVDASADLVAALRPGALPALATLVVEHRTKAPLAVPAHLRRERERRFGDTTLTYLVPAAERNDA